MLFGFLIMISLVAGLFIGMQLARLVEMRDPRKKLKSIFRDEKEKFFATND